MSTTTPISLGDLEAIPQQSIAPAPESRISILIGIPKDSNRRNFVLREFRARPNNFQKIPKFVFSQVGFDKYFCQCNRFGCSEGRCQFNWAGGNIYRAIPGKKQTWELL